MTAEGAEEDMSKAAGGERVAVSEQTGHVRASCRPELAAPLCEVEQNRSRFCEHEVLINHGG